MEQQHNYNETFGFINAITGHEDDNFGIMQSQEAVGDADVGQKPPMQEYGSSAGPQTNRDYGALPAPSESVQYQDVSSSSSSYVALNRKSNEFSPDIQSDAILSQAHEQQENEGEIVDDKKPSLDSSTTARKESAGKKRKRIVLLNDDEDSDGCSELKKEIFSKLIDEESQETEGRPDEAENSQGVGVGGNEADVESEENDDDEAAAIVNPDALKARFLLKSAIIIQDPDKKKKKKHRILDSDVSDEEQPQQPQTSVDDIGLVAEDEIENEHVEETVAGDIIIFNEPIESAPLKEQKPGEMIEASTAQPSTVVDESRAVDDNSVSAQIVHKKEDGGEERGAVEEPVKEENIDEVLERIKPMADDDDFFKYEKSSGDEDNAVNNEEYFGTPDKSVVSNTVRKRGPRPGARRKSMSEDQKVRQKRGDRYEKDFVDDSASSDSDSSDYSDSLSSSSESSSSGSSVEEVKAVSQPPRARPIMKKLMPTPPIVTLAKVPSQRDMAKKDRFYDQSRNIPDSVYFGDVKVPLHVLHTKWNSSMEEKKVNKNQTQQNSSQFPKRSVITITKPQSTHVESTEDPKLSTLKELIRLTGIKINYTKLFDGVRSTDHKCMIIRRILAQKGLEGEPTVAKCKKLKRDLQAKREIAELDKSVIITEQGRTRRSRRNVPPARYSESNDFIEQITAARSTEQPSEKVVPQILETLSKIKSVIDSDSE